MPGEGKQSTQLPIVDIESTALDFLALLLRARGMVGTQGDYSARLTVHPPTEIFRRSDAALLGHFAPWDEQRVYGYRPVDGQIVATLGRDEILISWLDLVSDAINQAEAACILNADEVATNVWLQE